MSDDFFENPDTIRLISEYTIYDSAAQDLAKLVVREAARRKDRAGAAKPTIAEWVAAACSRGVTAVHTDEYGIFFYSPGDITVRLELGPLPTAIGEVIAIEFTEPGHKRTALTPAELRAILNALPRPR